jgi:PAS domain S-box-containing protein/putative nucleotidyltransferase with HDIG domain
LRDITDRKKAETALKESEEKYKSMVENSLQGIVIIQDFRVVYCNTAFTKISGYSEQELLSLTPKDVRKLVHPDDQNLVWGRMKKRLQGEDVTSQYEYRGIRKDGTLVWLQMVASVIEFQGKPAVQGAVLDITDRIQAKEELQQSYIRLRKIFDETVNTLASAVEMRDPYTVGHQQKVAKLACAIAQEMTLAEEQIEGIRTAGLIHDIGKIYVPAEILSKPTPLTEAEKSLVRSHSQVGHDILKGIEFPWPVAEIVLQHHERMLGSGYPQGLTGENILLEARILAVADVVETMYSHRPYRAGVSLDKTLQEISRNRGLLYDPEVVDVCLDLFMNKGFKLEQDSGPELPVSELTEFDD